MRSRARAALLLSTGLAVCGLAVGGCGSFGRAPGVSDGGAPLDGSVPGVDGGASEGGPSVLGCAALRASDPSVKRCIDFDEPASTTPPAFGFDTVTSIPTQLVELRPSPLGVTAGNSLLVGLSDGAESRIANGQFVALEGAAFPAPRRLLLDIDIVVDELALDYAALAAFQVAGSSCDVYSGVAVAADGLRWVSDPGKSSLRPIQLGVPFHVRLIDNPRPNETTDEELIVDGVSLGTTSLDYDGSCSSAGVIAGAFFTSAERGKIRARFDQIVLRVE